jgi:HrpA-like RNA helicase
MSNYGDRRAHFDQLVRYSPPKPTTPLKVTLPPPPVLNARPEKRAKKAYPENYPFNPGQDISTIFSRFGAPSSYSDAPSPTPPKETKSTELPIRTKMPAALETRLSSPGAVLKKIAQIETNALKSPLGDSIKLRSDKTFAVTERSPALYETEGYELARQLRDSTPPHTTDMLREELPVYKQKAEIVRTVLASPLTVIQAETGSGKTTLVPQFLEEAGFKVTVLGPRRLPTQEVAQFVATMRNEELGHSVGFRHGLDDAVSEQSRLVYATEGHELARWLHTLKRAPHLHTRTATNEVIIFDEFHERQAKGQLLLALLMMRKAAGYPIPKIIIMSATLDLPHITAYFGNVPIINVKGRLFPVTEVPRGQSPAADTVRFLNEGKNPLSFHYGEADIKSHIRAVREQAPAGAEVFPLYGKLPREQQQLAIAPRKQKAVAATNTVQTSVTLEGMKAVIVTGYVRRLVLDVAGIPSLVIEPISQDAMIQQIGRVGRTAPGVYVSHAMPFNDLKPHAPSEIQSIPLETHILEFAAAGIPFSKVNQYLFDRAKERNIQFGYNTLYNLGLAGPEGHITGLGLRVAALPVSARMGKLVIKALDYQKQHGAEILDDAIRIAAIVESEGILTGKKGWKRLAPEEHSSDLMVQNIVYHRALTLTPEQRAACGINEHKFLRARDNERKLRGRLKLPEQAPPYVTASADPHKNRWLVRAIIEAYADSVFRFVKRNEAGDYLYKPLLGDHMAVIPNGSVVAGAPLITGFRFNVGYLDGEGARKIQPLVLHASRVDDVAWLNLKTPPHLARGYKEGISIALRPPTKKKKSMKSRDFRKEKSMRNGKKQSYRG